MYNSQFYRVCGSDYSFVPFVRSFFKNHTIKHRLYQMIILTSDCNGFISDGFVSSGVVQDLIDKVNQLNETVQQQSKTIRQLKGNSFIVFSSGLTTRVLQKCLCSIITGRIQCEVLTTSPFCFSWIKKFLGQQSKI